MLDNSDRYNLIEQGVNLFNNADYFAAHDFFEKLWIESRSEEKQFFQGLVQISVGSFHMFSGNFHGAQNQFSKGRQKLMNFPRHYYGIDNGGLILKIESIISELRGDFYKEIDDIDIHNLPEITKINNS